MGFLGLFDTKSSLQKCGILTGATDRHSHILYGVDDGIRTQEDSLAALEFEESLGVSDVWLTPHVMEEVPNATDFLKSRFYELGRIYNGTVKLHLAAEYMLDTLFEERLKADDLLLMDDDMVLVETSVVAPPYDLRGILSEILSKGYRPLFAHPERCSFLTAKDCEDLVGMGVRLQLNLPSIVGYYGNAVRGKAEEILKKGLYFAYGSDCHRVRTVKEQYSRQELKSDFVQRLKAIR